MSIFSTVANTARAFVADAGFWANVLLGVGDVRDPSRNWRFHHDACEIQQQELEDLWNYNPVARRICNAIVEDALRQGFEATGEQAERLHKADREKGGLRAVARAAKWGRALGGAAIIADTGEPLDQPLPDAIRPGTLKRFLVRERRHISPEYPYDIEGGAEYYKLAPAQGTTTVRVHRSRLQLFLGEETTTELRRVREGFGLSVLEVVYAAMRSNASSYDAADRIVQDLSQAVFKLHGVVDALSDDTGKEAEGFLGRIRQMDRARSVSNAVVLDADNNESFEQVGRANPSALPAILDKSDQRLAQASGMPITRLMGISPGGLNATGDSDIRGWYDVVSAFRQDHIQPVLEWVLRLIAQDAGIAVSADEDLITWPSLWQRTPAEEDERRTKLVSAYAQAVQAGILLAEEAAAALVETGAFPELELDEAKRQVKEALADQLRAQLAANGPPQVPPGKPGDEPGGGDGPPSDDPKRDPPVPPKQLPPER